MSQTIGHPAPAAMRNRLLRALSAEALAQLAPQLERVSLTAKDIVLVPDQPVEFVHFLESGTVSMISTLRDGGMVEVGLIGLEGFVGLSVLLGAPTSPLEGVVQLNGTALRMTAREFGATLPQIPGLLALLLRYVDSFHVQVAQSATCNARHQIEPRLARWLLMTQEFMSHMLGVQRPGVSIAMGALLRAGLVRHRRSMVEVIDRAGLEAASCECYAQICRRLDWIMAPPR